MTGVTLRDGEPDATTWTPPGPGRWQSMADHFPWAPTPLYSEIHRQAISEGTARLFARFGVPARHVAQGFANGRPYQRILPLAGPDRGGPPPPTAVIWALSRLHPELRRRAKRAGALLVDPGWEARARRWYDEVRPCQERANLAIQDDDPSALDDAALLAHLERATANVHAGLVEHFDLHGDDIGPLGMLLTEATGWGLSPGEVVAAFHGASPASAAPAAALAAIGDAVRRAGATPRSVVELRAVSAEVEAGLDAYLRTHGWRMITRYDLDGRALIELPEVLLRSVLAARPVDVDQQRADAERAKAALRARVPAGAQVAFDRRFDDARAAYGVRDDNGPFLVQWPAGLLRRAALEAGRRLADRGHLTHADHVFELCFAELRTLLRDGQGPAPSVLADRAARRQRATALDAPAFLGPDEPPPPLKALPRPLATLMAMTQTAMDHLASAPQTSSLCGTGVGTGSYRGRARVARTPEDALAHLEPGDVLIAPNTTPAYNVVFQLAGAVVVEEGGLLCHAAVIARELGIPAVVGVTDVFAHVHDGDDIEVDAAAGQVRVLA